MSTPAQSPAWHFFVPKLVTVMREGYGWEDLRHDALAGLTVAIVALPLAMALAIASGTTPDKGLITAIVAGFLISALGGSRFQIGGPTGAFIVVVFNVIAKHGYDGLLIATLMAGVMLIVAGLARFGTWIKYIPQPVVTGFTAGIAVVIFSGQIKDLLGLSMNAVPADFIDKWRAFWEHRGTVDVRAVAIAAGSLAIILALRRFAPKWPGFLIAVAVGALAVWGLHIPIDTIGSRFGQLPAALPHPALPHFSFMQLRELLPSAFTIAFLGGVESLLCAVVADGMTGRRHRSNCELVAQGIANIASVSFGGLPATGAIARTATNIRSGARTPVAGMLHALFLLIFMWLLGPLTAFIPLASLAAVLVIVAWNMSEYHRFVHLMSAPLGDRVALLATFGLTVIVDLTVAIEVGVVLAAVLFMHRMSQAVEIQSHGELISADADDFQRPNGDAYRERLAVPKDIEVFELRGPFFFGVANNLVDVLQRVGRRPKAYVLLMREVPLIDATGVGALTELIDRAHRQHIRVILAAVQPRVLETLKQMKLLDSPHLLTATDLPRAIAMAHSSGD